MWLLRLPRHQAAVKTPAPRLCTTGIYTSSPWECTKRRRNCEEKVRQKHMRGGDPTRWCTGVHRKLGGKLGSRQLTLHRKSTTDTAPPHYHCCTIRHWTTQPHAHKTRGGVAPIISISMKQRSRLNGPNKSSFPHQDGIQKTETMPVAIAAPVGPPQNQQPSKSAA